MPVRQQPGPVKPFQGLQAGGEPPKQPQEAGSSASWKGRLQFWTGLRARAAPAAVCTASAKPAVMHPRALPPAC